MTTKSDYYEALGRLMSVSGEFENNKKGEPVKGRNQLLQKILGAEYYFRRGSKWFYNMPELKKLSTSKLNSISDKIEAEKLRLNK